MDTTMEDLIGYDAIKHSALSKSIYVSPLVKGVTLGPNRVLLEEQKNNDITIPSKTNRLTSPKEVAYSAINSTNLLKNQIQSKLGKQRHDYVKAAMDKHINRFKEFSENQEVELKAQTLIQQQQLKHKVQQQEFMIAKVLEQHEKDSLIQQQQLVQNEKRMAERKKRNDLELQEKERQKQQVYSIIERLKEAQVEFRNLYQDVTNVIMGCKYIGQLKVALGDVIKQLNVIPKCMEEVVAQCKAGIINEAHCLKMNKLIQELKEILEVVKQKAAEVNEIEERAFQVVIPQKPKPPPPPPQAVPENLPVIHPSAIQTSNVFKFVSKRSLEILSELQLFKQTFELSLQNLTNVSFKKFTFDCKKAVNIPVNAISATSPSHLTDKYKRLLNLLNGSVVEVGGVRVCAGSHPQGVAYCQNLLAGNFVQQGDLMISSNPEAAFAYSAVIVALWNDHPQFGKLVLAYFYEKCPYLVPIYPPRTVGQTDEEFYSSQGYCYSEGVVEDQDKFLKRMTGIMRLYAAITITRAKKGHPKNPLGLNEGWRWLAAFVNLEPKPFITATMLHVFLETAGFHLAKTYGKSFRKLILHVFQVYLPLIQKIDSGGPITRLEVLLQDYAKQGNFKEPNGLLSANFW